MQRSTTPPPGSSNTDTQREDGAGLDLDLGAIGPSSGPLVINGGYEDFGGHREEERKPLTGGSYDEEAAELSEEDGDEILTSVLPVAARSNPNSFRKERATLEAIDKVLATVTPTFTIGAIIGNYYQSDVLDTIAPFSFAINDRGGAATRNLISPNPTSKSRAMGNGYVVLGIIKELSTDALILAGLGFAAYKCSTAINDDLEENSANFNYLTHTAQTSLMNYEDPIFGTLLKGGCFLLGFRALRSIGLRAWGAFVPNIEEQKNETAQRAFWQVVIKYADNQFKDTAAAETFWAITQALGCTVSPQSYITAFLMRAALGQLIEVLEAFDKLREYEERLAKEAAENGQMPLQSSRLAQIGTFLLNSLKTAVKIGVAIAPDLIEAGASYGLTYAACDFLGDDMSLGDRHALCAMSGGIPKAVDLLFRQAAPRAVNQYQNTRRPVPQPEEEKLLPSSIGNNRDAFFARTATTLRILGRLPARSQEVTQTEALQFGRRNGR